MDFTANNLQIIGLDVVKGTITLGIIEPTNTGYKLLNKSLFRIMPMSVPYAFLNLGLNAEITVKDNVVMGVKTLSDNEFITSKSQKKAYGVAGLVVDSVNAVTHVIKFEHPKYTPIKVLCMCAPKVQKYVIPLSGERCVLYLSTNNKKITLRYKTIVGLTPYK